MRRFGERRGASAAGIDLSIPKRQRGRAVKLRESLRMWFETTVAFRSAKGRSFAERKTTDREVVLDHVLSGDRHHDVIRPESSRTGVKSGVFLRVFLCTPYLCETTVPQLAGDHHRGSQIRFSDPQAFDTAGGCYSPDRALARSAAISALDILSGWYSQNGLPSNSNSNCVGSNSSPRLVNF